MADPTVPTDLGRPARHRWSRFAVLTAVAVAIFAALLSSGSGGDPLTRTVANLGLGVAALGAAVACLLRAAGYHGRARLGWTLIGLGVLAWGGGQVAWIYAEMVHGAATFPSEPDIGYLGMVLLTPAGLLILPSARQVAANRARSVLDGLMVAGSLMLIAWTIVVQPLLRVGGDSTLALGISLAYPLGDVVILTIVVYMLALQRSRGPDFVRLALVGAGFAAFAVADIGYAYLNLIGTYATGDITDIGWFAGFSLIALAARKPVEAVPADGADDAVAGARPFGLLLPYVAVLAALVVSILAMHRTGLNDSFVVYTRSALILLMVGRQLLTLLENRGLTRDLEARVAGRTAELFASEQRFHALVQHSSDVVTVVDPETTVLYQSESVHRVFGHQARPIAGMRLTDLLEPEAAVRLAEGLRAVAGRPYATTTLELTVRHRDGRVRQAEMTVTNLLGDPNVGGFVLNTRDVSERNALQAQLVHEAYHDTLTQLANRALFRDRIADGLAALTGDDDLTVLFLDLDGFKEVNDSLGHLAGDQLLVQVADRLRAAVRAGDVVARFGGDEFAVLVAAPAGAPDPEIVAQRIVDGLRLPFRIDDREIHVQASIGLSSAGLLPRGSDSGPDQLMRNADLAMYRAKSAGGSGWASFHPDMLAGLVERLELEADLRLALDRGELELHYQPTVDLRENRVAGFEALVRWRHPVRGMISPLDFIPLAEATGLIVPLGRWVLEEACRQAVAWGGGIRMAVNVSVRQLDRCDLAAAVSEVLAETGMPARNLCLEMTESVLMTDTEENLEQLVRLKALGLTLAIDDFGTGYSSLAYLRRFPVDILKIDRSFVERVGLAADQAALAGTIIALGQSLGMVTVAEGIEEYGQLAALRAMGCTYAQGYYFSRPVPAAEAARLVQPLEIG